MYKTYHSNVINTNITDEILHYFSCTKAMKSGMDFYTYSTSQLHHISSLNNPSG